MGAEIPRDERGRVLPGYSLNPSGRPKSDVKIRDLARQHTEEAIETLVKIMRDMNAPPAARVAAAEAILNRGYGRPPRADEEEGMPFVINITAPRPGMDPSAWGVPSDPEKRKKWLDGEIIDVGDGDDEGTKKH